MVEIENIGDRLRLKAVVDQSSVSYPPNSGVGDLPTIFNQIADDKKSRHYTIIDNRECGLCALLSAMSKVTYESTLNDFVDTFLNEFLVLKASIKGEKMKKLANICAGNVELERRLEFARIKSKKQEEFV